MKKTSPQPSAIVNRRARYDYELGDEMVAGIVLSGKEVRAARLGHVQLRGSYVGINRGELWLTNASFSVVHNQKGERNEPTVDNSPRKLLVHRQQIDKLSEAKTQGYTVVPTKLLTQGRHIKLVIALARGKKNYDKRQAIKKRDTERDNAKLRY